jgi:RimJ/RimL family protein N-acetyltransferase
VALRLDVTAAVIACRDMRSVDKNIGFRSLRASDAATLARWARTPDELLQWAGPLFSFPLDEIQLVEYAERADERLHLICAVDRDTDRALAHAELGILPEHELGRIGRVAVAPEVRGEGVGRRLMDWLIAFAFDDLALHRLELVVFSFNEPALRCYRRAGFREEGLARHARKASDGYWDIIHMALLASWRSPPPTA